MAKLSSKNNKKKTTIPSLLKKHNFKFLMVKCVIIFYFLFLNHTPFTPKSCLSTEYCTAYFVHIFTESKAVFFQRHVISTNRDMYIILYVLKFSLKLLLFLDLNIKAVNPTLLCCISNFKVFRAEFVLYSFILTFHVSIF